MSFDININGNNNNSNIILDSQNTSIIESKITDNSKNILKNSDESNNIMKNILNINNDHNSDDNHNHSHKHNNDVCEFNLNLEKLVSKTNIAENNNFYNKTENFIYKSVINNSWYKFNNYATYNYQSIIERNIIFVSNFINDLILESPYNKDINIYTFYEDSDLGGYTKNGDIYINGKLINKTISTSISNIRMDLTTYIFIHELLHILQIIPIYNFDLIAKIDNRKVYIGKNGVNGYKKVLKENNFETENIICIPLEDDFGEGSAYVHFEQGKDEDKTLEIPIINNVKYPIVENEIMTPGFSSTIYAFLTTMTTGVLKDNGFLINDTSKWIVNKSNTLNKVKILY